MTDTEITAIGLVELVRGLEKAEGIADSRESAGEALRAVHRFLKGIPAIEERNLEAPIFGLLLALSDLGNSTVAPMLKGAGSANRHPDRTARRIMKAYCSYVVDRLLAGDLSLEQACRIVAGALEGSEILKGQSAATWERVKNWRAGAMKLPPDQQERMILDALRTEVECEALSPADAAALIRRLEAKIGRYG